MTTLVSFDTQEKYSTDSPIWKSDSGSILDIEFEARFDLSKISSRPKTLWRYREAIPIEDDRHIVSFEEGYTPLIPFENHGKKVLIKQEQLFSTGSYKDRGAAVLMSKIKELGISKVVQDSSGNAGCAIAAYAAKAGISCDIYVPAETSPGKIAQIQLYGAQVHRIPGTREDTAKAAYEAAQKTYYASHYWNPYFFHGTKTLAYEICEQLNWKAPGAVVIPAGHGTLVLGCYIGFRDLLLAGIISDMPKLVAIQAERCSPLAQAFMQGAADAVSTVTSSTLAEGIAIAVPLRGAQILQAVRETKGTFVTVTEPEIRAALIDCGRKGFCIEPTSAAVIAGLSKYAASSDDHTIVSVFSGHGLKASGKILELIN